MATISPTPWRLDIEQSNAIDVLDANGNLVATVYAQNEDELSDQDRENARAIVGYVNTCAENQS